MRSPRACCSCHGTATRRRESRRADASRSGRGRDPRPPPDRSAGGAAAVPRAAHSRWSGVRADALALPLRSGSFRGLILGNEMLADLPVRDGTSAGAVQLVREVSRVLSRGGAAAFTEFGGDFPPAAVDLTDGTRA